ncbi:MAG: phosphatase [Selenomonadaceae bacterium]|nr:phosphatase [Selenomonadaceae bacterium]
MKDILDVHIHTTASRHAYSTFGEVIAAAKQKNLELVGIADHAPSVPGAVHKFHFVNFKVIPRDAYGIKIVMGAELNVIDYSGSTDLPAQILKKLDYAIASLHRECIESGSVEENTSAIIGAMKNPHVVIIGHPDNPQFPADLDAIARAAKDFGVLLEVNSSSYLPNSHRTGSAENAKLMLAACKKYGTKIIMGSDAHIDLDVGNHELSQKVLAENDFPEELVVNTDTEKFFDCIRYRNSLKPKGA